MKTVTRVTVIAAICCAAVGAVATPALGAPSATMTPSSGLVDLQRVTIEGTGYTAGADVGSCQGIDDGSPDIDDCGTIFPTITASSEGSFSVESTVRRFIYVPILGTVDCAVEACLVGVAELSSIPDTLTVIPISFAPAPPPPATRGSISLSPEHPVADAEATVEGTGFRPNARIEILQCAAEPEDPTDCAAIFVLADADSSGAFSARFFVNRFFNIAGNTIVCSPPGACVIAAAEVVDVPGTIVTAPLELVDVQPDAQIRSVGTGFVSGDDIYNTDGTGQARNRAVAPGNKWSFALQIQNDGDLVDDITVTAPSVGAPFTVRYFVGYYNITSLVNGGGFTFADLAPGETRRMAVQFSVAPGAAPGASTPVLVTFSSGTAPRVDVLRVGVFVPSA